MEHVEMACIFLAHFLAKKALCVDADVIHVCRISKRRRRGPPTMTTCYGSTKHPHQRFQYDFVLVNTGVTRLGGNFSTFWSP